MNYTTQNIVAFDVNEDLVTELRAEPITCTSRASFTPANDMQVIAMIDRMRRESLYVA